MLFNYSTHDKIVTIDLGIIPDKNNSIFDLTDEYYEFRKMYKDFLKQVCSISIEEEIHKKIFIELITKLKNSNGYILSLVECEDTITSIFYSYTDYEDIIFDYEDTLYTSLAPFLESFQSKYENYNFIDFIVYKTKIKILATKIKNIRGLYERRRN